ncbi:MAG TPA: hypothetical protein VLA89_10165 [Gemmatimonadales bacterium]|nr:hypothetical protein [Gemmatimonadales bacterium]
MSRRHCPLDPVTSPACTGTANGNKPPRPAVLAVDVTGQPVGALVVPASRHENRASELVFEHLTEQDGARRLKLVGGPWATAATPPPPVTRPGSPTRKPAHSVSDRRRRARRGVCGRSVRRG